MNSFALKTELGELTPAEVDQVEKIAAAMLPTLALASRRPERGGVAALVDPEALADRAFAYGLAHVRESRAYRAGKSGASTGLEENCAECRGWRGAHCVTCSKRAA